MTDTELLGAIKRVILTELDLRDRTEKDIADDEALFGSGLGLDSLDALQLAMAIEEHFGVRIPEGEESREIFASIRSIAEHIERCRS